MNRWSLGVQCINPGDEMKRRNEQIADYCSVHQPRRGKRRGKRGGIGGEADFIGWGICGGFGFVPSVRTVLEKLL